MMTPSTVRQLFAGCRSLGRGRTPIVVVGANGRSLVCQGLMAWEYETRALDQVAAWAVRGRRAKRARVRLEVIGGVVG